MRFSDEFGVRRLTAKDDWFDLECSGDTPLFVDPFLVFDDLDPFWSQAQDELTRFFVLALECIKNAGGNRKSQYWAKAERMLTFPEPKEFALGLSMGPPRGIGHGAGVRAPHGRRAGDPSGQPDRSFSFIEAGMGVDRISDAFCNIFKAKFIAYLNPSRRCRVCTVCRLSDPVRVSVGSAHGCSPAVAPGGRVPDPSGCRGGGRASGGA